MRQQRLYASRCRYYNGTNMKRNIKMFPHCIGSMMFLYLLVVVMFNRDTFTMCHVLQRTNMPTTLKQNRYGGPDVPTVYLYGSKNWPKKDIFDNCQYPCSVSMTTNYNQSSAVMFDAQYLERIDHPPRKHEGQVWILHLHTPDDHVTESQLKQWRNLFNWTMGYRDDSDIFEGYGSYVSRSETKVNPSAVTFEFTNKTHHLSWLVSNCFYVQCGYVLNSQTESKPFIIDTDSKCAQLHGNSNLRKVCAKQCEFYQEIQRFPCKENAQKQFQENYLTIPVSSKMPNFTFNLPPGNYASLKNFKNPRQFNNYIMRVTNLKHGFLYYLKLIRYQIGRQFKFCELCRRLHHVQQYKRLYKKIDAWYFYGLDEGE